MPEAFGLTQHAFHLEACAAAARAGKLQDWVLDYLSSGYWTNPGLRDGLQLHRRWWIGPLQLDLARLERCCGPEPEMPFRVPVETWNARTATIAAELADAKDLPPLIAEWSGGRLFVRDGNHRHGAMTSKRWTSCYAVVWCNSEAEHLEASEGARR